MLRELNENEMEMVSGGLHEEGHDEVVVTAQRIRRRTPSGGELNFFGNVGMIIGAAIGGLAGLGTGAGAGSLSLGAAGAATGVIVGEDLGTAVVESMYDVANAWADMSQEDRDYFMDNVNATNDQMQQGCHNQCPW